MSISLCSTTLVFSAPAQLVPLLGPGNYSISELQIVMLYGASVAAGIVDITLNLGDPLTFFTFYTAEYVNWATGAQYFSSFDFGKLTFPDPLIIHLGNQIQIGSGSYTNFSSVQIMVNIAGTVLP